jgi:hypothetical protein
MNAEMLEVFEQRKLPLSEYITKAGLHPMADGTEHLEGLPYLLEQYKYCCSAQYEFPNGKGCSVISGKPFYCNADEPFEVLVNGDGDPHGYLTDEGLLLLLVSLKDGTYESDEDREAMAEILNSPTDEGVDSNDD